jgi:hypothetical protein
VTTPTTVLVQLKVRSDTAANWTSANPTLLANELGRETDTGKIKIGTGSTAWTALPYQPFGALITNADISATAEIAVSKLADGAARQLLQTDAAGTGVEWTSNVDIPGTLDVTGTATFDGAVTVAGDLTVNGTTTTIDTQTLLVEDKNIEMGVVATPTDVTADGGGITLRGTTNKTINWVDATDAWTSSERFSVPLGSGGAPSLTFTGDPNTGIYSPGADQVAISTNGTKRIEIQADGDIDIDNGGVFYDATNNRLAIGTTSPSLGLLEVSSTNGVTLAIKNTTGTTAGTEFCQLTFNNTSNSSANFESAKIKAISTNGGANLAHLTFENSGTERARIDSSGRLLVGTSSTSDSAEFLMQGNAVDPTGGAIINLCNGKATPVNGEATGIIRFSDNTHAEAATIMSARDGGTWSGTSKPSRLTFSTTADGASSPTERMRITSAGKILYNTTTAADNTAITIRAYDNSVGGAAVELNGWGNGRGHALNCVAHNTANADVVYFNTSAATVGSISITSTATAYNTSSDYRLKENIVPVIDGIIRLKQLKPSRFNFLTDPSKVVDGFVAHEVQSVVPEAVTGTKDEIGPEGTPKYQGIDQSKLVPLLTAALQEAIGEIESLKARVAALELLTCY